MSLRERRRQSQFQRAADGSMTLIEHIQELRTRLFRGSLGVVAGSVAGFFVADRVINFLNAPYCDFAAAHSATVTCQFAATSVLDPFMLKLKVALYIGLLIAAPIWLYQLWAFIAPGLHRRERRYTYAFVAVSAPLFVAGVALAYLVVSKSLRFFLFQNPNYGVTVNLNGYFDFVTGVMLLFGAAFEFPLIVVMLNFAGLVSARKLLGWWRVAIFLMFFFAAVVTPTPDPFGMTILAACMATLYFSAVGVAFLNDRRRARRNAYAGLSDDEASSIEPTSPVDGWRPDRHDEDT